jgi:glycosyltransferase involved in cell wall biosynthesis
LKISIALATWRGTAYLQEQLESLAAQTRLPDELVASDDASNDATIDLLEAFALRAPFEVRILRNDTNLGFAGNFDRALGACTGDLVFPCDQDDVWFPEKLAQMERWAYSTSDVAIFACDTELTDTTLAPSGRTKRGQLAALGLPMEAFVMGCCLAIRREFLDIALPIPAGFKAHDTWIVELADTLGLVERRAEVLQYYRQHGRNTSDFSANTIDHIGFLRRAHLWKKGFLRRLSGNGGLCGELERLRQQGERIAERNVDLVRLLGAERSARCKATLNRKLGRLEARAAVRSASIARRPLALARNWRQAGYTGRAGLVGAMRDLTTYTETP